MRVNRFLIDYVPRSCLYIINYGKNAKRKRN
ncbi:hypothetical protein [Caudoviricetes sp.]|nr:hypothetical protein [Caudoviricetes sp.]